MDNANLRRMRDRLDISQSKMAGLFGVSVRTLQGWEGGRKMPTAHKKLLEQAETFFRVETKNKT